MRSRILLLLLLCCFTCIGTALYGADTRPVKRVLTVASYQISHKWTRDLLTEVRHDTQDLPVRLSFDTVVELDYMNFPEGPARQAKEDLFFRHLQSGEFSLIFAMDDSAVMMLLRCADRIPPDIPVIFAGYENFHEEDLKKIPNMTGAIQRRQPVKTLRVAFDLCPGVRRAVFLYDSSESSRLLARRMQELIPEKLRNRVDFMTNGNGNMATLFDRLRGLDDRTVVILLPWRQLDGNDYQGLDSFGVDLRTALKQPFFSMGGALIRTSAVGGFVDLAPMHGKLTASLFRKVLESGSARNIPVAAGESVPVFNYEVMKEHHMDFRKLPENAILWKSPPPFYETYKHEIRLALVVLIIVSIAVFLYIRILQRHQAEMLKALQKARTADRAKSIFLATMSHEIRTPLNAVIGFAELLKNPELPLEVKQEYLEGIHSSGNALLDLINDILDLTKLEAGQMFLTPVKVSCRELLDEMEQIFKPEYSRKNLSFHISVPDHTPLIFLDKLRIRQILLNLIGNAVKFTKTGSVSISLSFDRVTADRGTLTIHVKDTGPGIAPEEQKKLFQPFMQSDSLRGTVDAAKGTGLGLVLCRRFVEKMKGTIEVQSEVGEGSDFIVILPEIVYHEEDIKNTEASVQIPENEAEGGACRILLVDNAEMNLKVMKALLEQLGAEVRTAVSGKEALDILEKWPTDAVLTDLWMPGMSGVELAETVRKNPRFQSLPVAAVTADSESRANYDMSIFDSVMYKPVRVELLRQWIATIKNK